MNNEALKNNHFPDFYRNLTFRTESCVPFCIIAKI